MPTVLRVGPYRFFFYSNEKSGTRNEPIHIHVTSGRNEAKFWLVPIELADNDGYSKIELNEIKRIIVENQDLIKEKWNDYFN